MESKQHKASSSVDGHCHSACRFFASAEDFYRCIVDAASQQEQCADAASFEAVYRVFYKVLSQAVNQKAEFEKLQLPGMFAKINHLAQECFLDSGLVRAVNNLRVRLRRLFDSGKDGASGRMSADEMRASCYYDLRTLCLFVEAVYDAPVPPRLREMFPSGKGEETVAARRKYDCVRLLVTRWDDEFIYGVDDSADSAEHTVCYSGRNKYLQGDDWTYIRTLLTEQVQVNLVAVREDGGVWMPELIIVEPDILLDVSSVAACLEHYGDSPYTYLLNRIKPNESTVPMILGNFASMLLDNALQHPSRQRSYKDCAVEFFQRNALQISTADIGSDFHAEGQRQNQNIYDVLSGDWTSEVSAFDKDLAMTEPSFFCEALGLQGRMDFLQLDYTVLMEQKSGKGAYPPNPNPEVPNPQSKHYAQMILYMAILHYGFGMKNVNAYLLYSKYAKGLLGLGPAPALLYRAVRLRNQMAWMERMFAQTDLAERILRGITADTLNVNSVRGVLWEQYTKPQIDALLSPVKCASALEQAYFFRMLKFVMTEHLIGKIGTPSRDNSGFASKWHESLDEKVASGSIHCNMRIVSPHADSDEPVEVIRLLTDESLASDATNFRKGDIVVLYAYRRGEVPDVRRTMVFRCSIEDIASNELTLRLRAPQTNVKVFFMHEDNVWCIEHDYFESSATSLMRGLYSFLAAPKRRRDLILSQRNPETDDSRALCGEYGERFNGLMLNVKQAKDFFLIVGPPGTGKTSFGMLNTLKEELLEPDSSVLLLSYTNRAVDEICGKLLRDGIDFIRVGGALTCSEECRPNLLESKVSGITNKDELCRLLKSVRVYAGTTSSVNSHAELFKLKHFTLAIVDEASQILEPHIIGLLSAHEGEQLCIDKFVFIGDHKQLPAVVQQDEEESSVSNDLLSAAGLSDCRLSLFERLYRQHKDNPQVCQMLTRHGRMHQDIADFPNKVFYHNRLQVVPLPHQVKPVASASSALSLDNLLESTRVAFIDVPLSESPLSDRVNAVEADIIARVAVSAYRKYSSSFDANETLGVIVPYRNQIAAVRTALAKYDIPELMNIGIDTVERYQGSQRKVVIYGFTIQQRHQLNFLCSHTFQEGDALIDRKLNVAMTRAMEHLVLVGNAPLLSESPVFHRLIEYVRESGGYLSYE